MATNQTKNYSLNQWALSDSVIMADFNADNEKVDEALSALSKRINSVENDTTLMINTVAKDAAQNLNTAMGMLSTVIPHVSSGSYVGTGTAGADNPNTLRFGFKPLFLVIITEDEKPNYAGTIRGIAPWFFVRPWKHTNKFYNGNTAANSFDTHVTWFGNGVSWYALAGNGTAATPSEQLNESGTTYHYIVIG